MQQLLNMGFPHELAAQALAATGGNCTLKATEWILSHKSVSNSNPDPSSSTPPIPQPSTPFQPKIDRFFHSQSKTPSDSHAAATTAKAQSKKEVELEEEEKGIEEESQAKSLKGKRPKQNNPKQEQRLLLSSSGNSLCAFYDNKPLSERMRPRTIDEVVGQDHILASNSLLRSAIDCNRLPSIVFWGPPGTGKTSIARAIVNSSSASSFYRFVSLSAVTSGIKDVRDAVEEARKLKLNNNNNSKSWRTVLFVDEVHRFNKSQQDSFLPVIEDGSVVFMGATTENPSFHLITPLLSRCVVLTLNPLKPLHVATLLKRAVADSRKGLARSLAGGEGGMSRRIEVKDEVVEFLSAHCDGDARVALNALEISATTAAARSVPHIINQISATAGDKNIHKRGGDVLVENEGNAFGSFMVAITLDDAKDALQRKHLAYDKAGEEHYNLISALHKSMRGSDADAAIYWLVRMLEGGEQPLYIARRLIRFASEDVGLADPSALTQAVACYQACHFLGMPECNVNLAQCVAYMALAPKSISIYQALEDAEKVVRGSVGQNEGVPLHLRNAPTKLMKELGYGKGYIYPPNNASSSGQTYLPPSLQGYKFLHWPNNAPTDP